MVSRQGDAMNPWTPERHARYQIWMLVPGIEPQLCMYGILMDLAEACQRMKPLAMELWRTPLRSGQRAWYVAREVANG